MNNTVKKIFSYAVIVGVAVILAFNYHIFIVENHFAPAGLNGIATMIQFKTGFSISYMSLIINVPLCILAYFFVEKKFAVKTLVFSLVYSVAYLLLQQSNTDFIKYNAQGHDTIFPVIISGVISGLVYGICLKCNASTGGTDVMAAFINKRYPEADTVWVIFFLNVGVAVVSFFVYGFNYAAVILCIVNSYVTSKVGDMLIKGPHSAAKFEVITAHPEELAKELIETLHHGCTAVPAKGMYSGEDKYILICVVNRRQVVDFERIIAKYDNTFAYLSTVNKTIGIFHQVK